MNRKSVDSASWRSLGAALFAGRFLVRPSPRSDESYLGYRLRFAFANGASNPNWLACAQGGMPKTHGVARWCPHCLAAPDAYWREDWYTGPAACLAHQCWLTSTCGACRKLLRWKQVCISTCACGALLQDSHVEMFSADVLRLATLAGDSDASVLSVGERWNLARFLGALSLFGLRDKPMKRASRQTENIERTIVTVGASLLIDQSASYELLDRLRARSTGPSNVPLLSQAFPHLLTMVRKQLCEAERHCMLNLLARYVAHSRYRGFAVIWERKGVLDHSGKKLSIQRKTRNPAIVTALAQTGVTVPIRKTRTGRQKFAISDSDFQVLREARGTLVPVKTASRYMGISAKRIRALATANLIASIETRIDTRSIDSLLANIMTAGGGYTLAFDDPICLTEALRRYVPVEASAPFFQQIMNGSVRLAVEQSTIPPLRGIVVDRGNVISATKVPIESSPQLSVVEAARRLGVKQEVMYHLIDRGLMRAQIGKLGRRTARVVDVGDLARFTAQFLPLFTAARAVGVSARKAPEWARQHGIQIVSGPSVDGGRQYWIRRPAPNAP